MGSQGVVARSLPVMKLAKKSCKRSTSTKDWTIQSNRKYNDLLVHWYVVILTNLQIRDYQYGQETLELTSQLLKANPEYYTVWNHRRLVIRDLCQQSGKVNDDESTCRIIADLLADELTFSVPLLRKYPKCYWIWNYRLWLLEEAIRLLPVESARNLWLQELVLASKMLSLDSRNFNGWGYRRKVITALENPRLSPQGAASSLTQQDFDYTTKMVNSNLSNFSAWHNRSKLIPRLLNERKMDHNERRKFLDEGERQCHPLSYNTDFIGRA